MTKTTGSTEQRRRLTLRPAGRTADGRFSKRIAVAETPDQGPMEAQEIKDLARGHTQLAIETLAAVAADGNDDRTRLAAAEALLDRGWGKPGAGSKDDAADAQRSPSGAVVVRVETGIRRQKKLKEENPDATE